MGDLTTKTVKVPESKADKWDAYVAENPEVDSISHLIRLSVEREMQGLYDQPQTPSDDSDNAASGEVLTALRQLRTSIDDLEERVSGIERVGEAEANYDIQKATFSMLPEPPESEVFEVPEPGKGKGSIKEHVNQSQLPEFAMTADKIARRLGAEADDVQDALDKIQRITGQVSSVVEPDSGETYYWKKIQ